MIAMIRAHSNVVSLEDRKFEIFCKKMDDVSDSLPAWLDAKGEEHDLVFWHTRGAAATALIMEMGDLLNEVQGARETLVEWREQIDAELGTE